MKKSQTQTYLISYAAFLGFCLTVFYVFSTTPDQNTSMESETLSFKSSFPNFETQITSVGYSLPVSDLSPSELKATIQVTPCPEQFSDLQDGSQCYCSAETVNAPAALWGNKTYSVTSNICRSALHAGEIGYEGGIVTVRRDGTSCHEFPASASRGVESQPHKGVLAAAWFAGAGKKCQSLSQADLTEIRCPAQFSDLTDGQSCYCAPDRLAFSGPVWGAGPFSDDSDVCGAAQFLGVISETGGMVRVSLPETSCGQYLSATAHKVNTLSYVGLSLKAGFDGFDLSCDQQANLVCPNDFSTISSGQKCYCPTTALPETYPSYNLGPFNLMENLCEAAYHSGKISNHGGMVQPILSTDGQKALFR